MKNNRPFLTLIRKICFFCLFIFLFFWGRVLKQVVGRKEAGGNSMKDGTGAAGCIKKAVLSVSCYICPSYKGSPPTRNVTANCSLNIRV